MVEPLTLAAFFLLQGQDPAKAIWPPRLPLKARLPFLSRLLLPSLSPAFAYRVLRKLLGCLLPPRGCENLSFRTRCVQGACRSNFRHDFHLAHSAQAEPPEVLF